MEDGGAESETHAQFKSSLPREEKDKLKKLLVLKVYKRRWFVLLVLCLLNLSNATLWLSFAPVSSQTASYLGVSLAQVNWLSLVYMLLSVPLSLGTTWMLDTLGLRLTLIVGSWLNMTGAVIRFLGAALPEYDASSRYPVVLLGQAISALAQPLIIFTPTKLAALWFPVHQRTTANMLASMSNPLGLLLANILSPLLEDYGGVPTITLAYMVPPCVSCLLATVGVRSSVPPTSPSPSAQSGPEPFLQGLKLLVKNRAYLVLMLCLGSGIASFTCFSSLLDQILCVQGYSNEFAGLCGALFIIWGIVGAGLLGVYVDRTKKFIEVTKINLSLSSVACAAFSVVALMPGQQAAVAVVCSLFGFFGFSVYPVAMELSVECSYPVGEATSAGLIFASGASDATGRTVCLFHLSLRSVLPLALQTPGGRGTGMLWEQRGPCHLQPGAPHRIRPGAPQWVRPGL
ncbi:solute carrier family 49 member A3 isoform X2 [Periophthalmus magnuspinnatus]|uniref:solute carrier family 49 member A3 isoform X2 n=1 Tax=Periophthalmus magnuspinnatus TaxID=409849 RepID=UPI002436559C|nr:solute carrier family 49 member A3 isoform X2 [Periophthalmus magnuspinnatus]